MLRNEKGQSLIEMALIMPVFLLLLSGMFDIGKILYSYSALHFTAQETVRMGGLGKTDTEIINFARDNFKIGDSTLLTITISPEQSMRNSGDYVTVTLQYPIKPITPMADVIFSEEVIISADSTIRVE